MQESYFVTRYGVADWALACPAAARLCFWWLLGAAGRRAERLSPRARYVPWLLFLAVPCLGRCNDLQAGALPRSSRAVHDRGCFFLSFSFLLTFFIAVNRFSLPLLPLSPLSPRLSRSHNRPVSSQMCTCEGSSHLLESRWFLGFCDLRVSRGVVGCGVGDAQELKWGITPQSKGLKRLEQPITLPPRDRSFETTFQLAASPPIVLASSRFDF
jgi:hypothetical protein